MTAGGSGGPAVEGGGDDDDSSGGSGGGGGGGSGGSGGDARGGGGDGGDGLSGGGGLRQHIRCAAVRDCARAGIGWGSSLQLHLVSSLEILATRRKYPPAELPESGARTAVKGTPMAQTPTISMPLGWALVLRCASSSLDLSVSNNATMSVQRD